MTHTWQVGLSLASSTILIGGARVSTLQAIRLSAGSWSAGENLSRHRMNVTANPTVRVATARATHRRSIGHKNRGRTGASMQTATGRSSRFRSAAGFHDGLRLSCITLHHEFIMMGLETNVLKLRCCTVLESHPLPALPGIARSQARARGITFVPQHHPIRRNDRLSDFRLSGDAVLVHPDQQHSVRQQSEHEIAGTRRSAKVRDPAKLLRAQAPPTTKGGQTS